MSVIQETGQLSGAGGLEIHWRSWRPADELRAVVVLAHGASEHSGRYEWVAEQLVAAATRSTRSTTAATAAQPARVR